jgi:hypothetical protein
MPHTIFHQQEAAPDSAGTDQKVVITDPIQTYAEAQARPPTNKSSALPFTIIQLLPEASRGVHQTLTISDLSDFNHGCEHW